MESMLCDGSLIEFALRRERFGILGLRGRKAGVALEMFIRVKFTEARDCPGGTLTDPFSTPIKYLAKVSSEVF